MSWLVLFSVELVVTSSIQGPWPLRFMRGALKLNSADLRLILINFWQFQEAVSPEVCQHRS